MSKKSILIMVSTIVIVVILNAVVFNAIKPKKINDIKIPDGYISVFHGGTDKEIYETYIYKLNNRQENQLFNYVNVTKTKLDNSNEYKIKITKNGAVKWTDEVFMAARENQAYSYVTLPNSDKKYTIDEYMNMFIIN